jgi:tetratricopeptide (TPR) repeat protein
VEVVSSWTGGLADSLRQALRMSNESFAEYLGVAVRTVAYWRKQPEIVPRPAIQEALDTALERAPARVKAQFSSLASTTNDALLPQSSEIATSDKLTADDKIRLESVKHRPSRLDATAIDSLNQILTGQRHLEDAIGPAAVLQPTSIQLDVITQMLRDSSGRHRDALADAVSEWMSFVGWLNTAVGQHERAVALFRQSEDLADETGNGVIAATATSFRGYVSQLQGRPRGVIRASAAALATPGAHPTQRVMDMLLTAQAYADLGDKEQARRFLDQAADLAGTAGEPPTAVYWYTEPFFRLNIGLAQLAIGDHRDAVESLKSGIEGIPADQRSAEWLGEYQRALSSAKERS